MSKRRCGINRNSPLTWLFSVIFLTLRENVIMEHPQYGPNMGICPTYHSTYCLRPHITAIVQKYCRTKQKSKIDKRTAPTLLTSWGF